MTGLPPPAPAWTWHPVYKHTHRNTAAPKDSHSRGQLRLFWRRLCSWTQVRPWKHVDGDQMWARWEQLSERLTEPCSDRRRFWHYFRDQRTVQCVSFKTTKCGFKKSSIDFLLLLSRCSLKLFLKPLSALWTILLFFSSVTVCVIGRGVSAITGLAAARAAALTLRGSRIIIQDDGGCSGTAGWGQRSRHELTLWLWRDPNQPLSWGLRKKSQMKTVKQGRSGGLETKCLGLFKLCELNKSHFNNSVAQKIFGKST